MTETSATPGETTADPAQDALDREAALAYVAEQDKAKGEDFASFWAAQAPHGTRLRGVFGVDVELPSSLPIEFDAMARQVQETKDPDVTKRLVGMLFGQEALATWSANGCTADQFGVLLMWGSANAAKPHCMSLQQALDVYMEQKARHEAAELAAAEGTPETAAAASGKARKTPARKPSGARSSTTGQSSRRTSRASTA